jgi:hypothetical protein
MTRPGEYTDRGMFVERGVRYRPQVGAGDGVIAPVPDPWFDRFVLRWLPHLALRRARARAELRRLEPQLAEPPGTCRMQSWNHAAQRWEPAGVLLPPEFRGRR